jgi:hypothetical protein
MKKILTLLALASLASINAGRAQDTIWNYSFGTNAASWTTGSSTNTFLPAPTNSGGNTLVRIGTGAGSFTTSANDDLVGVAPTGSSINKFSIYDFANATTAFSVKFDMTLTGGSSGSWLFWAGNGATFSNANTFSGADSFTGLRFTYGADGAIAISNRAVSSWVAVTGTGISQSNAYTIEIIGNNGSSSLSYGTNTLANNTFDLWVGGTLITNLGKAQLANSSVIDSFMFYGESSTANVATITLEDLSYANYAVTIPEPSTYALLALSGLALAGYAARRRQRQK